jgi:3-oxoadipate enol-lactonase
VSLLLHALGEDSSDWNAVAEALAPANRVYALDLRGHKGSSQPGAYSLELICSDVLEFLHALDLDDVFLIGHCLGGAVYLVAAAEPRRVRLMVLEEPAPPLPAMPPREVPPGPTEPFPSTGVSWRRSPSNATTPTPRGRTTSARSPRARW